MEPDVCFDPGRKPAKSNDAARVGGHGFAPSNPRHVGCAAAAGEGDQGMTPHRAFTIGYQGADRQAFIRELVASGVSVVVDTRERPMSRRPDFRREALRAALESAGVRYESRPRLGVPKRVRALASTKPRRFAFAYGGVLRRADDEVDAVAELARREVVALLCFEVDPERCHRALLAVALASRAPLAFEHLLARRVEDADDHPVPEDAVGAHHQV